MSVPPAFSPAAWETTAAVQAADAVGIGARSDGAAAAGAATCIRQVAVGVGAMVAVTKKEPSAAVLPTSGVAGKAVPARVRLRVGVFVGVFVGAGVLAAAPVSVTAGAVVAIHLAVPMGLGVALAAGRGVSIAAAVAVAATVSRGAAVGVALAVGVMGAV